MPENIRGNFLTHTVFTIYCHQVPYFKINMHKIGFRLPLRELTALLGPLLLRRRGKGKEEKEEEGRGGKDPSFTEGDSGGMGSEGKGKGGKEGRGTPKG